MIDGFDLFLYNGHAFCEIVVFPHRSGQLFNFCVCYSIRLAVADDDAQQCHTARNQGNDDSFCHEITLYVFVRFMDTVSRLFLGTPRL